MKVLISEGGIDLNTGTAYTENLFNILKMTEFIEYNGAKMSFDHGVNFTKDMIKKYTDLSGKIFFIGNGGSAAIASHGAIDYMKNGGMQALCFSDGALLTCFSNDFGYESVFEKPLSILLNEGDILVAISSSGKSQNIINAVKTAKSLNAKVITLSGFSNTNELKNIGDINIYVPSLHYGMVELSHQIILHMIVDFIIATS